MRIKIPVALFSCLVLAGSLLLADEPKKPEPSAEEKAAWAAMEKAASPGDAHKKLSAMVGDFDTKVSSWMAPGTPPVTSMGRSHNSWALDGRWVEERFTGTFSADQNTITGAWETSPADGGAWEHDFALTYRRVG